MSLGKEPSALGAVQSPTQSFPWQDGNSSKLVRSGQDQEKTTTNHLPIAKQSPTIPPPTLASQPVFQPMFVTPEITKVPTLDANKWNQEQVKSSIRSRAQLLCSLV